MFRIIVVVIYAIVLLLSLLLVFSAARTLMEYSSLQFWRPDQFAQSGIAMAVFMVTVILLQVKAPVSGPLGLQVVITGILLGLVFLRHGFPQQSTAVAIPHLICAVGFACWNFLSLIRRNV
jgi:hypothetical protein